MDSETLSFDLSTSSRTYQSKLKSQFEFLIDFDEENYGDEELSTAYPCPYCSEDFDLLGLCCHIDLEHPNEAKSGICHVCAIWVGTNMVDHIAAQHGNLFKSQLKSKCYKDESYPTISFSRKGRQDEQSQYFSFGSSPATSTSKTACDPLLSFLYGTAAAKEHENMQVGSSSEVSNEEMHSDDSVLESRDVQPPLLDTDLTEKAWRSEFVKGLLMSTILDSDFQL